MKLQNTTIRNLAMEFIAHITDEPRQTIVDQLGFHPVNHARFVSDLHVYGLSNDRIVYFDLTRSIEVNR